MVKTFLRWLVFGDVLRVGEQEFEILYKVSYVVFGNSSAGGEYGSCLCHARIPVSRSEHAR